MILNGNLGDLCVNRDSGQVLSSACAALEMGEYLLPDRYFVGDQPLHSYLPRCHVRVAHSHDVDGRACGFAELPETGVSA